MNGIKGEAVVSCYVAAASLLIILLLMLLSERLRKRKSESLRLFFMISLCVAVNCVFHFIYNAMYMQPAPWCNTAALIAKTLREILADIEIVERRLDRAKKNAKSGDKKYKREVEMCEALISHLEAEKPAREFEFTEEDQDILADGGLLTVKPVIYVGNLDETGMANWKEDPNFSALADYAEKQGAAVLPVAAKFEEDLAELDEEEAQMFMEDLGLTERGLDRLIKTSYDLLGYISFLTAGEDDVHAWTIVRGTKAPKAAGKIHKDIERGFIRAEIVAFEDLKNCGSMAAVKEKGLFRLEGKDYVMQDGDVTMFRFNV